MMLSAGAGFINQSEKYSRDNAGQSLAKYTVLNKGELAYNHGASKQKPFGCCYMLTEERARIPYVYHCFAIPDNSPSYVATLLNNRRLERQLKKLISSSVRMDGLLNISYDDYMSVDILLPSLAEQQKIADFLSLVDERIEKQRQLVEILKRYKRGLFLSLYNNSQKSTFLFGDIYVKAAEGGTPSTTDSSYYIDGNIPFAKIEDLNSQYLNSTNCYITEKGLKSSSAWIVPIDSILFSNGATIGSCSINKIPTSTKQGILGIVPKENYSVEFLYFLFTSWIFIKKVKAITTKGTMDCAYLKDINKITLDIPDMYTQLKIQRIMNFFERGIEKQVKTLNFLIHQKNGLLQQMFI